MHLFKFKKRNSGKPIKFVDRIIDTHFIYLSLLNSTNKVKKREHFVTSIELVRELILDVSLRAVRTI